MKSQTHALLGASLFYAPGMFESSGNTPGWSFFQISGVCVAAVVLLAIAAVVIVRIVRMLAPFLRTKRRHAPGGVDGTSPGRLADPDWLSRHIVECAEQILGTLDEKPSEIEIEMCILGYWACEDDMITLGLLVEESLPEASPLRRRKLRVARRNALDALMRIREAFPAGVLRARHRERS